ncbi:hypothetical protein JQN61_10525 [Pseudomonas putida]|uniref:N-acetyltransferase domain-containing protein n=1 Tax=Pseudomonas putida TaxID=303 RepID=A0A2S3WQG6_PSEPU|nr:hypothetical protein [Pseudomonas putida]POG03667.1 hypothetical protein BGP82_20605 [Pseudomonas putida]QRI87784.1 hypothetical protein JQN61_10525 [Pseudomonas putida]HDS0928794.1 hypothetical protein [Pseudomonas putida]
MELELLRAYQQASRESAVEELAERAPPYNPALLTLREIDAEAIDQYEGWLTRYNFGWERVLVWKNRPAHHKAIDVAIWYDGILAGMCWASPRDSHDKIFVMYIERNPDNTMLTRGYIAPLGLSAVRNYGVLMELDYVVIEDPNPDARAAYQREHFTQLPGIGLAYDLTQDYDGDNPEVAQDDH